jgi:hypothetical protein
MEFLSGAFGKYGFSSYVCNSPPIPHLVMYLLPPLCLNPFHNPNEYNLPFSSNLISVAEF